MKDLFDIPSPNYLLVSDKPISDETATIHRLIDEEIFEELHFTYRENVITTEPTEQYVATRNATYSEATEFIQRVEARLRQPLNDQLIVCRMDEEVGHGVFTSEPIECGEIVVLYTGQATCHQPAPFKFPEQFKQLSKSDQQKLIEHIQQADYVSGTDGVNAGLTGGIARYMNHAPTHFSQDSQAIKDADHEALIRIADSMGFEGVLDDDAETKKCLLKALAKTMKSQFDPKVEALLNANPQLASANLHPVCFPYKGFMLEALVAKRPIAKNQQLVWDYHLDYYREPRRQNQLRFFDKDTGKVSPIRLATPMAPASAASTSTALSHSSSVAHTTLAVTPTIPKAPLANKSKQGH